ncbi:hypothetical protein K435DRAFT_749265 [Dendrothele bispora CBS 962.96]|uniref:RanBD1 domain-containing protein n=1 Tax=Dendrothele bispora (strain CBS 962.96) TaxID=1314807 RepID=A0A4V4HHF4_DENBC|nr:hypothetical protein K435DRAFT_749265 [Dendrothele bispora CBS 962.96]
MKIQVRQISQGVEDLNWKNKMKGSDAMGESQDGMTQPQSAGEVDNDKQANPDKMNAETIISVNGQQIQDSETKDVDDSSNTTSGIASRRGSDSEKDKNLKRKYLERGTSAGPQEGENDTKSTSESVKRPRDDADRDDNPRETKRPTPPPESEEAPNSASKASGFMAYASTSSPFAAVKGKNVFTSTKSPTPSSSRGTYSPVTSPSPSPFVTTLGESSSSSSTPAKRSGFEAFASSPTPFATATSSRQPVLGLNRAKSPQRRGLNPANVSAFSAYASGGTHGFALPLQKRARAGSPGSSSSLERNSTVGTLGGSGADSGTEDAEEGRSSSFGEKLRAGKDDDEVRNGDGPKLTEQEVSTGEEEEETIHQVRGKLYHLSDGAWKEKGTGLLKINVRSADESSTARLVMRKEAVYTVLLNVTLFYGMQTKLATDPRFFQFSAIENGVTQSYNLKLANAKIAQELKEEIDAHIPKA